MKYLIGYCYLYCFIWFISLTSISESRRVFRGAASSFLSTIARGGGTENISSVPFYSSKNAYFPGTNQTSLEQNDNQQQQQSQQQTDQSSPLSFFVNKKAQNLTVDEDHSDNSNLRPTQPLGYDTRAYIPFVTKEPNPLSSPQKPITSSSSSSSSSSASPFPIFRKVRNNFNQNLFQSYVSNRIKLFNKFKFKGFAVTFIKSVTEWNAAGVGVKIPITPSFPVYDSIIYLPRIVALISLNYPYCWKLSFTINIPVQVLMMMLVILFEYSNSIYQTGRRVMALFIASHKKSREDGGEGRSSSEEEEEEEDDEVMNSFSDRDVMPNKNKVVQSGSSSLSPSSSSSAPSSGSASSGGKIPMKASESVKRLGMSVTYKFTEWGAKGNGWTMGPAFNYVSSLIITNKLLPMMILISVCFFSILETAFLLLYWMYEIYYFLVHQVLFIANTFLHLVHRSQSKEEQALAMRMMEMRSSMIPGGGEAELTPSMFSDKIYYNSPYTSSYASSSTPSSQLSSSSILQATGGGSLAREEVNYFINSNNDLSIYSDYEDYLPHNAPLQYSASTSTTTTLAETSTTSNQQQHESDQTNHKFSLSSFILSMKNQYHNYAQNKLHSQLILQRSSSSSAYPSNIWQINWQKIEKWILTKSPIFGYSMSTVMLPFPKKGLKLATNVNFDIQNFHPIEYVQKLWESFDMEKNVESMSKNTFM